MRQKNRCNMPVSLKRCKFYFLAIAILSFAIIVISYNWKIRDIYRIYNDISQVEIDHISEDKVRVRSLHNSLQIETTTEDLTTSTTMETSSEMEIVMVTTEYLTVKADKEEIIKTVGKNPNKTVETKGKTDNADKLGNKKDIMLNHFSQHEVNLFGNIVKSAQVISKENTDKNLTNKLFGSAKDEIVNIPHESVGQEKTSDLNAKNLESFHIKKEERQELLDRLNKLKSEFLSNHAKLKEFPKRKSSLKRKDAGRIIHFDSTGKLLEKNNVALPKHKHKFQKPGLAGNFINRMLWMPRDNQEPKQINGDISGATSRPDECDGCFANGFRRMINAPKICEGETDILILIMSTADRKDSRNAIRNTWCEKCNKEKSTMKYVFVFGNRNNSLENSELMRESEQFNDIIQMDFRDSYANLTYKTLSSLQWSKEYCDKAKYVMKTDDDMYVNTELLPLLLIAAPAEKFIGGMCWGPGSPHRDLNSKWYVSFVQYRHSLFPSMCSGTGYLMSRDTVAGILRQSPNVPFFHLEDVYVAICVKRLGITPVLLKGFKNIHVDFEPCLFRNALITVHEINADTLYYIWKKRKSCPLSSDLTPETLYSAIPV